MTGFPIIATLWAILGVVIFVAIGFMWGDSSANSKFSQSENLALQDAKKKLEEALKEKEIAERDWQSKFAVMSARYEQKISNIDNLYNAAANELGRLRIKTCRIVPTSAADGASASDGSATATGGRIEQGEINLDEVAAETVKLGRDYDVANAKIVELQSAVNRCKKAPTID